MSYLKDIYYKTVWQFGLHIELKLVKNLHFGTLRKFLKVCNKFFLLMSKLFQLPESHEGIWRARH